jgi:dynein light chain LC8-type
MKLIEKGEKTIFHKDIAEFMKKELDAQKGGSWNCIVGISFGSFVTHETKTLSHIAIGNVQIMIWRHG